MIKILIKKFIKDYENTSDKKVRESYGVLAGIIGILCNLFLFGLKITIGFFMNSIAIISDAVNNLSDMGSSVITIFSSKMSNRSADREHPFGHGRIEYISSMIVAFIIVLVGFELFKTSIGKIFSPETVLFSYSLFIILSASILVKVWMFSYNRYIAKKIDSSIIDATSKDSLNDCISTLVVILSVFIGRFTTLPVDGIMGLIVSGLIIYTGIGVAKEIIDLLLGKSPSKEFIKEITDFVLKEPKIVGVHDFIAHDYGPSATFVSLHAEVPDDVNIVEIHEIIDDVEKKVFEEFGVLIVIHMDPISLNCEKTNKLREQVKTVVSNMNPEFSIHDFRLVDGENSINLIFDLVVPIEMKTKEREEVLRILGEKVKDIDKRYNIVVQVESEF